MGDWLHRFYADWNLHKHYWDHIDPAEKLERAADNLEERYVRLSELRGGTAAEAKSALEGRLRRVADAKRRLEERRMAVLLAARGFTPAN